MADKKVKGKILITGASGLIGKRLIFLLGSAGYSINVLGRKKTELPAVTSYLWDVTAGEMDVSAFKDVTAIIHLAGAGVAEKRWTESRKEEIINSRVKSARLIYDHLKKGNHNIQTFINASAVGYYGDCGAEIIREDHKPGSDFLARVCKQWEGSAAKFSNLGIRVVCCRIGIVLAPDGGALPELTRTIRLGVVSYFAKKDLYYPWVHIEDVCRVMQFALENKTMRGPYNTVSPAPMLMKDLMQAILKARRSKALLLPAPPAAIKLALGEMSEMLLSSQRCSAEKLGSAGYQFKYSDIEKALSDIFN